MKLQIHQTTFNRTSHHKSTICQGDRHYTTIKLQGRLCVSNIARKVLKKAQVTDAVWPLTVASTGGKWCR